MFLYFVPRIGGNPFAIPPALRYAGGRGFSLTHRETMAGPEGCGPGWICAVKTDATTRVELQLNDQTWARLFVADAPADAPPLFVGRWNDAKLSPGPLQRPNMQPGHPVTLGDGSTWVAAIARGFEAATASSYTPLPRQLERDGKTGKWVHGSVASEYRRFLELALAYVDAANEAAAKDETHFSFEGIDDLAIGALSANYRIGPEELGLFPGVYSTEVRDELIRAALDWPTIEAWTLQKKTEMAGDGSGTSESATPSTPGPNPPSP
jgi:hypothetical protein